MNKKLIELRRKLTEKLKEARELINEGKVEEGQKATKPADPVKDGYVFKGWYVGDTAYDFESAVTGDVTLTAKWEEVKTEPEPNPNPNPNPEPDPEPKPGGCNNATSVLFTSLMLLGVVLIRRRKW